MLGRVTKVVATVAAGVAAAVAAVGAAVFGKRKAKRAARAERKARRKARSEAGGGRARTATTVDTPEGTTAQEATEVAQPAAETAPGPEADTDRAAGGPGSAGSAAAAGAFQSIKGIGPAMEDRLLASGVTSLAQIAAWTDADVETMAPLLKIKAERIRREEWVAQAQAAVGETA